MNVCGLTQTLLPSITLEPLRFLVWLQRGMSFQFLLPQLICKGVMLIAFQILSDLLSNPFSHVPGVLRVLLSDAFGKVDESMEGATLAAAS